MIFLTVGAQMPFDRLVRAVDQWAGRAGRADVLAQTAAGSFQPQFIRHERFLSPSEFRRYAQEAQLIVAHAGMGSILTALELGKPVLVMPRRAHLRETRNDHQVATARRVASLGVTVAMDEAELLVKLQDLGALAPPALRSSIASPRLIRAVRDFIGGAAAPAATPALAYRLSEVEAARDIDLAIAPPGTTPVPAVAAHRVAIPAHV